ELRGVAQQVLVAFEEGSPAWLEALGAVAVRLYFAGDIAWMPAAHRALETAGDTVPPAVRGFVQHALALGLALRALPEGLVGLEAAAETGRAAGNVQLESTALLTLASTLGAQGE